MLRVIINSVISVTNSSSAVIKYKKLPEQQNMTHLSNRLPESV